MIFSIEHLIERQSYITASEIAWVVNRFRKKLDWLPTYIKNKTDYQFFCDKTFNEAQFKKLNELLERDSSFKSKNTGSTRESALIEEYVTPHILKYEEGKFVKLDNLAATPDGILTLSGQDDKGVLEIKLTGTRIDKELLIGYHKWQVVQQMMCTGLKWGSLNIFFTKTPDNSSEIIGVERRAFFLEREAEMQQAILEVSKACLEWVESVKNGDVACMPDLRNKMDEIYLSAANAI